MYVPASSEERDTGLIAMDDYVVPGVTVKTGGDRVDNPLAGR
jgi:hypothetical protein